MNQDRVPKVLYASLIRLAVALVMLFIIEGVIVSLPMIKGLTIPGFPLSGSEVVATVARVIMIAVLLGFAQRFGLDLRWGLPQVPASETMVTSIAYALAAFMAYKAFYSAAFLLLKDVMWAYQLLFLLLVAIPVGKLGLALYNSVDQIVELARRGRGGTEVVTCARCGANNVVGARFCERCGGPLPEEREGGAPLQGVRQGESA